MTKPWRPEGWKNPYTRYGYAYADTNEVFEAGADAMHKADVEWLIERIIHDGRGYVFKMSDKEWQEFINDR